MYENTSIILGEVCDYLSTTLVTLLLNSTPDSQWAHEQVCKS